MTVAQVTDLFPSFQQGSRLIDGGELEQQANLLFSTTTGIIAKAGGTQAAGTQLAAAYNLVETCVSDNDSVVLPQAIPGRKVSINNATGHTLAVFGLGADTVAAFNSNTQQPAATGVTQATTIERSYTCYKAGQWKQGGN